MRRFDLRELKENAIEGMKTIIENDLIENEAAIFIFEAIDFSLVQKSADLVKELNCELLNSLKYNEIDWTISMRKRLIDGQTVV
ncbi:MAG: NADH-ubiquinone oxidoreductase subunit E family protein [Helicobacteraceae bacterium]|jgi:NADH-quinone oxidoreductase subunit E|nr:NADH-ubiquinone oxidoreductase subunit E family protein [Helicobacteraceae bacterium]